MSHERLFAWHDDANGPMQVVSGPVGKEKVHYEAPSAQRLKEMSAFITWTIKTSDVDPVLKSALVHLWFVTVHPFDDGNGRIARAIADWWGLARSENSGQRFNSTSAQILRERKAYYDVLEKTQKSPLDVTPWLVWLLDCLDRAVTATEIALGAVLRKAQFWEKNANQLINERQRLMLNKLLDGFEGKLTSSKWSKLAKCSQYTASRDIQTLIDMYMLVKDSAGGRSTSYSLKA